MPISIYMANIFMRVKSAGANIFIAALSLFSASIFAQTQAYTPGSRAVILETLPDTRDAASKLRAQRRALEKNPRDVEAVTAFARAAITLGRAEQDPRYFGYAQSALAPWLGDSSFGNESLLIPESIRLLRAIIAQWRHDFSSAENDLNKLVNSRDRDIANQAHLTRATLALARGNPDAALRDCAALIGQAETIVSGSCIAGANSLRGQGQASLTELKNFIAQADADTTTEIILWATTQAADVADRLGHKNTARKFYEIALERARDDDVRDIYLLTAYSDFLLDPFSPQQSIRNASIDDARHAISLLQGLELIDNILLRRALAERKLAANGDEDAAKQLTIHTRWLAERFAATRARGEVAHQREEALFELLLNRNLARALQLAQSNWTVQREPIDARLLLSAALANRKPEAAKDLFAWMRSTQIEDAYLEALLHTMESTTHL